jgi:hypothetical protein
MAPITRRDVHKLLLTAPAAALAATDSSAEQAKPSAFAACIAASEASLSADERARLAKAIAGLEGSLKVIREFKLPPDADPAMHFTPLRSRGSR